jgi:hypothetical protein
MATQIETKDCTALTDADLGEMADACAGTGGGGFEVGQLSKAKEDWVLAGTAGSTGSCTGSPSRPSSGSAVPPAC